MKCLSRLRHACKRLGLSRLPTNTAPRRSAEQDGAVLPATAASLYNLGHAIALEKISDAVAIADHGGSVRYYNAAFERMFKGREEVLTGADLIALVREDSCTEVFPVRHPDGGPDEFVAIIRDTREARSLEAQLRQAQKMEAVGRLAGGVAHDFNNLLTIINGYAELALISTEMSSPVFTPLREIRRAGEQAAELTQQLLAVGRSQVLQPRVVEMNVLVRDLIDMVHPLLSGSIAVVTSLDPDAGCVRVDPGQLRQALLNLVMNAKDAMPDGGSLLIETTCLRADLAAAAAGGASAAGEYVTVSVTDTGIGMDEPTRAHLFEPFFTTKEPGKGNGLGLSTTFGIVKQSGGHIQVRSEPGDGATFKLYFPKCDAEAPAPAHSSGRLDMLAADDMRGGETVLVLEDESSLRGLITGSLGLLGYTVLEARDAAEAETACTQHAGTIDLLLADAEIPGVEGIRLMRPDIRVLCMSGRTGNGMPETSGRPDVGAEYILKPFSPHCLARKLREILGANAPQIRPLCLVVDDEEPVRLLLARILAEAGYEVAQACDGAEAIEMVQHRAPGIVITDLVMPRKEGLETIAEVRRLAPHAKIIAISGAFGSRFLTVATHLGANAALAKPISADVLLRTVRELLSSE